MSSKLISFIAFIFPLPSVWFMPTTLHNSDLLFNVDSASKAVGLQNWSSSSLQCPSLQYASSRLSIHQHSNSSEKMEEILACLAIPQLQALLYHVLYLTFLSHVALFPFFLWFVWNSTFPTYSTCWHSLIWSWYCPIVLRITIISAQCFPWSFE